MAVVSFLMGHLLFLMASGVGLLALQADRQVVAATMSEANNFFIVLKVIDYIIIYKVIGYILRKYELLYESPSIMKNLRLNI